MAAVAPLGVAADEDAPAAAKAQPIGDLLDEHFASASGRQIIIPGSNHSLDEVPLFFLFRVFLCNLADPRALLVAERRFALSESRVSRIGLRWRNRDVSPMKAPGGKGNLMAHRHMVPVRSMSNRHLRKGKGVLK